MEHCRGGRSSELRVELKTATKKSLPIVHSFYCCLSSVARWKWIILFLAFWCINFHTTIFCFFTKAILSADWGYLAAVVKISDPVGCTESRIPNFSFQQNISILLLVHSVFVPQSNCCSISFPLPDIQIVEEASIHLQSALLGKNMHMPIPSRARWGHKCSFVINQISLHLPWKENKLWYDQPFLFL